MVVQHNLPAMNSHRQLGVNNNATSKNLEKLSSGYRINRAGDDAAGLAISEKMRGQIRGLDMATTNAENGVSLIQTAEGGLNETHAILQRMRELAVQSANGTYADDVDRENINKEVIALKDEIDRIASSTHYNGINLLDGSLGGKSVKDMLATDTSASGGTNLLDDTLGKLGFGDSTTTFQLDDTNGAAFRGQDAKLIVNQNDGKATVTLQIGDKSYKLANAADKTLFDPTGANANLVANQSFIDDKGNIIAQLGAAFNKTTNADTSGVVSLKNVMTAADETANAGSTTLSADGKSRVSTDKSELVFQIGANGGADQRVGLHVDNMSTGFLGTQADFDSAAGTGMLLRGNKVVDVDVSTREKANESIKILDDAINQVSGTRADLGALQNRLEHTINNLGTTKENLQAAESSIRDVDMAKEMMEFTKNNILVQASQSMLAQSNQLPQGVLQLLR